LNGDLHEVSVGSYRLTVPSGFGPRLLGLRRDGRPELFARLDDEVIEHPDTGVYRFRGGHRLWAAPEVPAVTYVPDDDPCGVEWGEGRVVVTGVVDGAGLQKRIEVAGDGDRLFVDHTITNRGLGAIDVAAWGITQMRPGGVAILPFGAGDPEGHQADRSVSIWPYTDPGDPKLTWTDRALLITARPGPKLKVGTGPDPGRLGYLIDGMLFTKDIAPAKEAPYPDLGAVGQVYVEDAFCELESVGPIVTLDPGLSLSHREVWAVAESGDIETAMGLVLR
jgi:hypothetical protein